MFYTFRPSRRKRCPRRRVALTISLDIVNAFNILPWDKIREALHGMPLYLRRILGDYLRDRCISYTSRAYNYLEGNIPWALLAEELAGRHYWRSAVRSGKGSV